MAKLMLIGLVAQVELTIDDETGEHVATCRLHPAVMREMRALCHWTERYDTMNDAAQYADSHADRGTC